MIKKIFTLLCLCTLCIGSAWGAVGDEISQIANIVSGKTYYIKGVRNISKVPNTFYLTFTDVTGSQSGSEASSTDNAIAITFTKVSDGVYTLKTPKGNYIAPGTSNGKINVSTTAINVSATNQSSIIRLSITNGSTEWSIQKNNSGTQFGGYKNTQTDITLIEAATAKQLSSIAVKSAPTKLTYTEGEKFNPSGLVITATYDDASTEDIAYTGHESDFTFDPSTSTMLLASYTSVAITYGGKTCTQNITVNEATKYAVTFIGETEQGTLTVKVNNEAIVSNTNLLEGTTVSLTSTPKTGYKQASTPFVVKDSDGGDVKVSSSGTFTMPAKAVNITAQFTAVYAINVAGGIQGGTIAIQDKDGNPITETSKGSKVVVAVTPKEHYSLASLYYVKDGEETQNEISFADDKYSFTMPQTAVTVYATFAEDEKYTVQFSVNGVVTSASNYAGEPVVFPTITPIAGYTFMGWTKDPINGKQAEAPEYVKDVTQPADNDGLYYAVFANKEGEDAYKKVTSVLTDWRGDYLVAYSDGVFMDGSLAGGREGVGKAQSHVDPSNALSADKSTITATWGDEHYVTIEAINDADLTEGYVIKSHSATTPYFYHTNNDGNGMSGTDEKSTAAQYPITISFISESDIKIALGGEATGAVLHYNINTGTNGEMFRYYRNGGQSPIYLYKKQEATYSDYCTTVPPRTFAKTISDRKMATLYLDYAVEIPTGVKAYTAADKGDHTAITLEKITDGVIPANTGVIIYSDIATDYTFTETTDAGSTYESNCLKGVTELTAFNAVAGYNATDYNYYALMADGGTSVVFKLVSAGSYAANSAYLVLPKTNAAKVEFSFGDEVTGIESLTPALSEGKGVYNLQGVRVNNGYKGIVIMNGKKYINK